MRQLTAGKTLNFSEFYLQSTQTRQMSLKQFFHLTELFTQDVLEIEEGLSAKRLIHAVRRGWIVLSEIHSGNELN